MSQGLMEPPSKVIVEVVVEVEPIVGAKVVAMLVTKTYYHALSQFDALGRKFLKFLFGSLSNFSLSIRCSLGYAP